MRLTIHHLQCMKCGRQLRQHAVGPVRPPSCPVCLTDTVILVSSRPMNDFTQLPDRRVH